LGFVSSIDRVEIVDARTVDIVTKYPDGLLLNRLAGFIMMVPPRYLREKGEQELAARPVGTGAFRFASMSESEVVLEANPDYWEEGLPKVKQLVFRFLEPRQQIEKLLSGEVDLVTEVPGTETFRVQSSSGAKVIKKPTLYTVAASFNNRGALSDPKIRQALNYAVDKEALIRYDILGNGRPVHSFVLLGDESPAQTAYAYQPAKARELLKSAGVKKLTLRMIELKATRAAKIIAKFWQAFGIKVEIVSSTDAKMNEDMAQGPWDVMLGGCPDPMHHPYFFYAAYFHSLSPFSLTRDPVLDKMIEQSAGEIDPALRKAKTEAIDRYINENALTLYVYQRIKTYGAAGALAFEPPASGMPFFRSASFAGDKR
jgi:peptide/nickel transport system substrate-binding protein